MKYVIEELYTSGWGPIWLREYENFDNIEDAIEYIKKVGFVTISFYGLDVPKKYRTIVNKIITEDKKYKFKVIKTECDRNDDFITDGFALHQIVIQTELGFFNTYEEANNCLKKYELEEPTISSQISSHNNKFGRHYSIENMEEERKLINEYMKDDRTKLVNVIQSYLEKKEK